MTYREKLKQANKEAIAAVIALVLTVIVWIISGFGIAPLNIVVFNTPLWIITGCFVTWIFAILAAVFMSKFVFMDIDLDDEDDADFAQSFSGAPGNESSKKVLVVDGSENLPEGGKR